MRIPLTIRRRKDISGLNDTECKDEAIEWPVIPIVKIKTHAFAVFSQRLCLEPVLTRGEANTLAEHSIANYMRLLTGLSSDRGTLHSYSPLEPILALASASVLFNAYRNESPTWQMCWKRLRTTC